MEEKSGSERLGWAAARKHSLTRPDAVDKAECDGRASPYIAMHGVILAKQIFAVGEVRKALRDRSRTPVPEVGYGAVDFSPRQAMGTNELLASAAIGLGQPQRLISTHVAQFTIGPNAHAASPAVPPPALRYRQGSSPHPPAIPPAIRAGLGAPPLRGFRAGSARRKG